MPLRWTGTQAAQGLIDMHADNGTALPKDNPPLGVFQLTDAVDRDLGG